MATETIYIETTHGWVDIRGSGKVEIAHPKNDDYGYWVENSELDDDQAKRLIRVGLEFLLTRHGASGFTIAEIGE